MHLKTSPAVFAVGNTYQIMAQTERETLVFVRVGEKTYYDESNGIMNSLSPVHRVTVPMKVLDSEKRYTVCVREIVERKPYFTQTEELVELSYTFSPVPESDIRIYHIADAHNRIDQPVAAAKAFGRIDLLILNGDVIDHSGAPEKFDNIYAICAQITNGAVPVVFSRGNHDMRGQFAEKFIDYTPHQSGNTYYTFRLGSIWGIVLDCGEDKEERCAEYGHTVACHCFRERQTAFLESVIENADKEYQAPGVKTRLVIAHNPFSMKKERPFDIEEKLFSHWGALLRDNIQPDLMICGHTHVHGIHPVDSQMDAFNQPCTIVVASEPRIDSYIGCGFVVCADRIEAVFTDSNSNILSKHTL